MASVLLAVVPVILGNAVDTSDLMRTVDDVIQERGTLRRLSEEEMFVKRPLASSREILECGASDVCLAEVLSAYGARLGLLVFVNSEIDPPLLSIRLIDVTQKRRLDDHVEAIERGSRPSGRVRGRLAEMLDARGHPAWGALRIEARPPELLVEVMDSKGRAVDPTDLLAPGRYSVRGRSPRHYVATKQVRVRSGERTDVLLQPAQRRSLVENPWLWVAVGAVVAIGTSVAVGMAVQPDTACICLGGDTCDPC